LVIQFLLLVLLTHSNVRHCRVICAHDSELKKTAEPSVLLVLN
jgi:hypothetical protein